MDDHERHRQIMAELRAIHRTLEEIAAHLKEQKRSVTFAVKPSPAERYSAVSTARVEVPEIDPNQPH